MNSHGRKGPVYALASNQGGGLGAAPAPNVREPGFRSRSKPSKNQVEVRHDAAHSLSFDERSVLADLGHLAPTAGAHDFAARVGLGPVALAKDARTFARLLVADSMRGLLTRGGRERSQHVERCGRLRLAKATAPNGAERYGVAPWRCKDRLCPVCGHLRAREQGWRLRQFIEARECWDRLLFVTLTHRKRPIEEETAEQAIKRIGRDLLRVFDTKFAAGRELARVFEGALFVIELTWSPKGTRLNPATGQSYYVAFSGWHAHAHALMEVSEGVKNGFAANRILTHWTKTADAEIGAQYIKNANPRNVGQLCKYVLKPMSIENPFRLRQAAAAVANIKSERARGEWKGWKKTVSNDGEWDRVEVSPHSLADVANAARQDRWLSWHETAGEIVRTSGVVEAVAVVRALVRAPETLNEAVKRRREASDDPPWWKIGQPKTFSLDWVLTGEGPGPEPPRD